VTLGRFALIVVAIVAVSGGATFFLDDAARRAAALYGAGVATLNALGAFAVMRRVEGRPTTAFLTAVLGGMGVRMVGVLLAVLLAVLVFDLPRLPLAASLLGHYAVFLALEMIAVQGARPTMAGAR
jgi:hypothetical protein